MKNALSAVSLTLLAASSAQAVDFVNGMTLSGGLLDLSGGSSANNGRVGYFSDIYYDPNRNEWWGLSDRGPGGGTLAYDTSMINGKRSAGKSGKPHPTKGTQIAPDEAAA